MMTKQLKNNKVVAITDTKEFKKLFNRRVRLYNALVEEMEQKGISYKKLFAVVRATEKVERLFVGGVVTQI